MGEVSNSSLKVFVDPYPMRPILAGADRRYSDMGKELTEQSEIRRLKRLYSKIPANKKALADGLIVQAARLRVRLNKLWLDIEEHGETELFSQSEKTEPYERERPSARLFTSTDKNYQSIIKQLNDMLPAEEVNDFDELSEFRNNI